MDEIASCYTFILSLSFDLILIYILISILIFFYDQLVFRFFFKKIRASKHLTFEDKAGEEVMGDSVIRVEDLGEIRDRVEGGVVPMAMLD